MGDCCIKANRCVAFGIRLRSHTDVCSLQTSPSAPCASSFLQSLDNLARKIVRLLTLQQSQWIQKTGEPIGPPVIVVCWYEIRVTQSKEKSAGSL